MSIIKRIWSILSGIVMIALSVIMAFDPADSCIVAMAVIAVVLLVRGAERLIYYFAMARWKVGGHRSLYMGMIFLELGFATLTMTEVRPQFVMLYLLVYYIFYAVIRIFSAVEAKKAGAGSWRMKLLTGIVCLIISGFCVMNLSSPDMMVYILCFGVIYSAVMRIAAACRRTAIVYIP